MRIADLARELGFSTGHIRRLERLGVIPPGVRDYNNHRRYSPSDLEKIRTLLFPQGNGSKGGA